MTFKSHASCTSWFIFIQCTCSKTWDVYIPVELSESLHLGLGSQGGWFCVTEIQRIKLLCNIWTQTTGAQRAVCNTLEALIMEGHKRLINVKKRIQSKYLFSNGKESWRKTARIKMGPYLEYLECGFLSACPVKWLLHSHRKTLLLWLSQGKQSPF